MLSIPKCDFVCHTADLKTWPTCRRPIVVGIARLGEAQVKRDGLLKQYDKDALTELNPVDTGEEEPISSSESRLGC